MLPSNIKPISPDRILYLDNHLIAVNKKAGEPVQADESADSPLLEKVREYLRIEFKKPGNVFCGLIHRLDRPVSGIVLFARTSKGLSRMNEAFRNRNTQKIYHALVRGPVSPLQGTLRHWLLKNAKNNKSFVCSPNTPGAREAILHYQLLKTGKNLNLIEIQLETGRHHQIRTQLSAQNWPIFGDVKYGDRRPLPDLSIALHAFRLDFCHPVNKNHVSITAPYPETSWWNSFFHLE